MATYYLVDGARVRMLVTTFNGGNHSKVAAWIKVDPKSRMAYAESKGLWYRATTHGWDRGNKVKPKVIAMSEMVEAITKTSWKEVQSEVPPHTF